MKIYSYLVVCAVLIISGCASTGSEDTSLHWVRPTAGSHVQLNEEVSVSAGARFTVQYGKPKSRNSVTEIDPFCYFFVNRPSDEIGTPMTIMPDRFVVTRVYRQREFSALQSEQYAFWAGGVGFNNGSSNQFMTTFMELSSSTQPYVKSLRCTRWDIPWEQSFLSIDEMQGALGNVAEIIPPNPTN